MSTEEAAIGLASPGPTEWMPYSVSMPHTLGMATDGPYPGAAASGAPCSAAGGWLDGLAGPPALDGASTRRLLALGQPGTNVNEPLALPARGPGPAHRAGAGGQGRVAAV